MPKTQPIILTDKQRAVLSQLASQSTGSQRIIRRAQIILASERGKTVENISKQVNLTPSVIFKCRQRWRNMALELQEAESAEDESLKAVIQEVLGNLNWTKDSSTISNAQVAQIVAISREDPQKSGRNIEFWTMAEMANEAIKRGIVEHISVNRLSYLLRQIGFRNHAPPLPLHRRQLRLQQHKYCTTSPAESLANIGIETEEYRPAEDE